MTCESEYTVTQSLIHKSITAYDSGVPHKIEPNYTHWLLYILQLGRLSSHLCIGCSYKLRQTANVYTMPKTLTVCTPAVNNILNTETKELSTHIGTESIIIVIIYTVPT